MKKGISLLVFMAVILSGCQWIRGPQGFGATELGETFQAEDRVPYFPSNGYIDMENMSSAIVVAKTGERRNAAEQYEEVTPINVTIEEVLSEQTKKSIEIGEEVTVYEPYWIDEENGNYQTTDAYIPLEEGKRYILFLQKASEDSYAIAGNRFGVYQEGKSFAVMGTEYATVEDLWAYSFVPSTNDIDLSSIETQIYTDIEEELQERFFRDAEDAAAGKSLSDLEGVEIFGNGVSKEEQPVPDSLSSLEERSSQIVSARVLEIEQLGTYVGRTMGADPAQVRVEITEVYKGNSQKEERITVVDNWWMHWVHEDVEHLNIKRGSVPLEPGEEYILFLDAVEDFPSNNPYTVDNGFGVYHSSMEGVLESRLDLNTYEDIKGYTFLAADEATLERYQSIREAVLAKYGNGPG